MAAAMLDKSSEQKLAESEDSGNKKPRKSSKANANDRKESRKSSKNSEKESSPSVVSKNSGHVSVPVSKSKENQKTKENADVVTESTTNDENSNQIKKVSMEDLMDVLMGVKKDQKESNKRLDVLASKVNEMYDEEYDENQLLYGDDDYEEFDENVDDENNNPPKRRRVNEPEKSQNENNNDKQSENQNNTDKNESSDQACASSTAESLSTKSAESSNFKEIFEKYKVKEKVDLPVDKDLAELINNFFSNGLQDSQLSDLMKNSTRPENCEMLKKTKVNQMIWGLLSEFTKAEEHRVQYRQGIMINAAILIAKLVNELSDCKKKENGDVPYQKLISLGTDALGLLGHLNRNINLARRDFQRPDLSDEYYHLCSPTVPFTEYLYGDDVSKKVSDIDSVNKISRKVRRGRGFGYGYGFQYGTVRRRLGRGIRRGLRRGGLRGRARIFRSLYRHAYDRQYDRDYHDEKENNDDQGYTVTRYDFPKNGRRRFSRRPRY